MSWNNPLASSQTTTKGWGLTYAFFVVCETSHHIFLIYCLCNFSKIGRKVLLFCIKVIELLVIVMCSLKLLVMDGSCIIRIRSSDLPVIGWTFFFFLHFKFLLSYIISLTMNHQVPDDEGQTLKQVTSAKQKNKMKQSDRQIEPDVPLAKPSGKSERLLSGAHCFPWEKEKKDRKR